MFKITDTILYTRIRTFQSGAKSVRESPLWVASLYPPKKYINILVENLYYAI
jgi:hypothetical protein